ncbi:MAG: DivIVA domain-containing protein [Nocardioides sp.]
MTFRRRMFGADAAEVAGFLDQVAEQTRTTARELAESLADNDRLRAALQQVQAKLEEYEQIGERVNEQVIEMFSRAQLVTEEMIQDASRDARDRIGQARTRERKVVEDAIDTTGQQVRSYALKAQEQMQTVMDSFAREVDQLTNAESGKPVPKKLAPVDPLFGDLSTSQIPTRNGSGPEPPGSG